MEVKSGSGKMHRRRNHVGNGFPRQLKMVCGSTMEAEQTKLGK